jgi:hypothetical protein
MNDEGVRLLAALPSLTLLDLRDCELVTDAGVRALARVLPQVGVRR